MKRLAQLALWLAGGIWCALLLGMLTLSARAQLTITGSAAFQGAANLGGVAGGGGGGGGGVTFSDDFNRADAATLGANWTVYSGSMSNQNNTASAASISYVKSAVGFVTNTTTVSQYSKITLNTASGVGVYPEILLRINGTNDCYGVQFRVNEDQIRWHYYTNAAGGATTIATTSSTVAPTDTFGVTVTGTGTSTTVRVWTNPTGLPSAADNWDGDTTPTVSFTDDPAVDVATGKGIGLAGYENSQGQIIFDNFFGGDIP